MSERGDKKPFHERVAEQLIEQLKAGTAPWQRPWSDGVPVLPVNPVTGKRYRGINVLQLMLQGHGDPRWLTYRQALSTGAQVLQGEKGTSVQYWQFDEERTRRDEGGKPVLGADGKPEKVAVQLERPRVFFATVFNAEQVEGLPALEHEQRTWSPIERAEAIMHNSGARVVHGGDRAYYSPARDLIGLPTQGQFDSADKYYATALHELGHWTGHAQRLGRDLSHPFGSEGYAREELRAEIASMLLGEELGLGHDPSQHAAYVGFWVRILEQDPLEIFRAASDAEKVRGFVLGLEQGQRLGAMHEVAREVAHEDAIEARPSFAQHVDGQAAAAHPAGGDMPKAEGVSSPSERTRVYLDVPYTDRGAARGHGALWDRAARAWYVQDDADPVVFARWTRRQMPVAAVAESTQERTFLAVPYRERHVAKGAGARWDAQAKSWYAPATATPAQLEQLGRYRLDAAREQQLPPAEPREELASALTGLGFKLEGKHPILDGAHHRVRVEGDANGERGGFYVAHADGVPAGYAKNHRTGEELRWKAKGYILDTVEHAQLRADAAQKLETRRSAQERRYEQVAGRLAEQLAELPTASRATSYQENKGLSAQPGIYTDEQGATLVPGYDVDGKLCTVQRIDDAGQKRFARGSRKHGAMHPIGGFGALAKADVLVIAEGYATAATVAELLGKPTVAAFDAGNLVPVAQALTAKYPGKPVLIIGDDDTAQERERGRNPGRAKAEEAAKATGGKVVLPLFAPGEQRERPKDFTDFNDLAQRSVLGRDGARSQLRHVYEQIEKAHRAQTHQPPRRMRAQAR